MSSSTSSSAPKRIYVFDSPRSCSQLHNKLYAAHPQLAQVHHPLMACTLYGPERLLARFQHSEAAERRQQELHDGAPYKDETYAVAVKRLEETVRTLEAENKIPWIKDHAISTITPDLVVDRTRKSATHLDTPANPTVFSDAFLDSLTPVILIRHPALMVPSWVRKADRPDSFGHGALDEDCKALTSLRWVRMMAEAYQARQSHKAPNGTNGANGANGSAGDAEASMPVIVDAQDVIYNTKPTITELCRRIGIDPDGVQYTWDPVPKEQWPAEPIYRVFFQDLLKASGVNRAQAPAEREIDIEQEMVSWTAEFGEKAAKAMRGMVEDEMPNYEFLRSHRIRV